MQPHALLILPVYQYISTLSEHMHALLTEFGAEGDIDIYSEKISTALACNEDSGVNLWLLKVWHAFQKARFSSLNSDFKKFWNSWSPTIRGERERKAGFSNTITLGGFCLR